MKKRYFAIAAVLLLFGCYLAVFALVVPEYTPVFYTVIGFDALAIAAQIGTFCLFITEPPVEEYFYRIPAVYSGAIYIAVQFIAAFILALVPVSIKVAIIVELVIVGIFATMLCYTVYAGLNAKNVTQKAVESTAAMKAASAKAKVIVDTAPDHEWRRLAKSVYDAIQYADPVTKNGGLEQSISAELDRIGSAVAKKDRTSFDESFARIKELISQRNG